MNEAPRPIPPFPKHPGPNDWADAVAIVGERLAGDWHGTSLLYSDPLGYLVAVARACETRHCGTSAYRAFLADLERQREAALGAATARRIQRERAMSDKEKAEEAAFYAAGGTDTDWSIQQEAAEQAKAVAAKKRAMTRMRTKARSTLTRGRASAT